MKAAASLTPRLDGIIGPSLTLDTRERPSSTGSPRTEIKEGLKNHPERSEGGASLAKAKNRSLATLGMTDGFVQKTGFG
jgi:hypothetical protein